MRYYVYILGSKTETLYIGVTNDLIRRVFEHKSKSVEGFSKKYDIDRLLYYEEHGDIQEAILREKRIKKWNREWKVNLIKTVNPTMKDLYDDIT